MQSFNWKSPVISGEICTRTIYYRKDHRFQHPTSLKDNTKLFHAFILPCVIENYNVMKIFPFSLYMGNVASSLGTVLHMYLGLNLV